MIRILVADDHPIVREGLKQILKETGDMAIAGEATSGEATLRELARGLCDVLLLDISMPGRGGIEILREIRRDYPSVAVLVLSIHPENQYGARVIRAGASGYLTKQSAPECLIEAVRKVASGGLYITPSLAEELARSLGSGVERDPHELLSDREFQVLRMIASGKTVGAIAEELALSVKTISTFRARILEKTGLRNNSELTRYAVDKGLLRD